MSNGLVKIAKKKKRLLDLEIFIRTLLNSLNNAYEQRTELLCDIHELEVNERGNTKVQISDQKL